MSTLPSGSDNRSEATTTEFTTAQSTHANSNLKNSMQQLLQQLTAHMTSEMTALRSEMATKSDIETIRSGTATMEQRMISEIGTLTTRSELDILMSRQTQETLEQIQK